VNKLAVEKVVDKGFIKEGDLVILTKGDQVGVDGGTNAMKIVNVGSVV
jgi:pyruvate kinase